MPADFAVVRGHVRHTLNDEFLADAVLTFAFLHKLRLKTSLTEFARFAKCLEGSESLHAASRLNIFGDDLIDRLRLYGG